MKPNEKAPLPWRIEYGEIVDNDGAYVARAYEENLDYILHACNAYPQLINFLENCLYTQMGGGAGALLKELGEDS